MVDQGSSESGGTEVCASPKGLEWCEPSGIRDGASPEGLAE